MNAWPFPQLPSYADDKAIQYFIVFMKLYVKQKIKFVLCALNLLLIQQIFISLHSNNGYNELSKIFWWHTYHWWQNEVVYTRFIGLGIHKLLLYIHFTPIMNLHTRNYLIFPWNCYITRNTTFLDRLSTPLRIMTLCQISYSLRWNFLT